MPRKWTGSTWRRLASAPSSLAVVAVAQSRNLTWLLSSGSVNPSSVRVERSANGSTGWAEIAVLPPGTLAYSDTTAPAGSTQYYRVREYKYNTGGGPYSSSGNVSTVPGAPANPVATVISDTEIDLVWDATAGATSYKVEQSANGTSGWAQIATPSTASQAVTGLTTATQYFFRVRAHNATGDGSYSVVVNGTTQ